MHAHQQSCIYVNLHIDAVVWTIGSRFTIVSLFAAVTYYTISAFFFIVPSWVLAVHRLALAAFKKLAFLHSSVAW